jgi:hypothetical protein
VYPHNRRTALLTAIFTNIIENVFQNGDSVTAWMMAPEQHASPSESPMQVGAIQVQTAEFR